MHLSPITSGFESQLESLALHPGSRGIPHVFFSSSRAFGVTSKLRFCLEFILLCSVNCGAKVTFLQVCCPAVRLAPRDLRCRLRLVPNFSVHFALYKQPLFSNLSCVTCFSNIPICSRTSSGFYLPNVYFIATHLIQEGFIMTAVFIKHLRPCVLGLST